MQHDFRMPLSEDRFEHKGALNSPPPELLSTLAGLRLTHLLNGSRQPDFVSYLKASQSNLNLKHPGIENDFCLRQNIIT